MLSTVRVLLSAVWSSIRRSTYCFRYVGRGLTYLVSVFLILAATIAIGLILSHILCVHMDGAAWTTLFLTVVTAAVIGWQGIQLQRQLELQTLTELYKEWNDEDMMKARCELSSIISVADDRSGIIDCNNTDNLIKVECVMEFLEKLASYYKNRVLSKKLLWDTIGWYVMRYTYYTGEAIEKIREKWGHDRTLYRDLDYLYTDLKRMELRKRQEKEVDLEQKFRNEIPLFKEAECYDR